MFTNSDDCGNCGVQTILEFTSFRGYVPGRDYIIGVKGFSSSSGSYTVDINCNITGTLRPTFRPTLRPTFRPLTPTLRPTFRPTGSTLEPTIEPTMEPTIQTVPPSMSPGEICQTGVNSTTYIKPGNATQREAAKLACEAVYGTCIEFNDCVVGDRVGEIVGLFTYLLNLAH